MDAALVQKLHSLILEHLVAAGIQTTVVDALREGFKQLDCDIGEWTCLSKLFHSNISIFNTLNNIEVGCSVEQCNAQPVGVQHSGPLLPEDEEHSSDPDGNFQQHDSEPESQGASRDFSSRGHSQLYEDSESKCPASGLFVIGGYGDSSALASSDNFDPITGVWEELPPMNSPRADAIDGKLFAVGGKDGRTVGSKVMANAECFDPELNQWTSLGVMGTARYLFCMSVIDDRLYVVGGKRSKEWFGGTTASVEVLDPRSGIWTRSQPMKSPRGSFVTVVLDGKLIAVGGKYDMHALTSAEIFDPKTGIWEKLASMASPRWMFSAVATGNKLFAFGGAFEGGLMGPTRASASVEVYDLNTGVWSQLEPMTSERQNFGGVAANGKLYVAGGGGSEKEMCLRGTGLATAEFFDPCTDRWYQLPAMASARRWPGIAWV